jgi:hypothetical protein
MPKATVTLGAPGGGVGGDLAPTAGCTFVSGFLESARPSFANSPRPATDALDRPGLRTAPRRADRGLERDGVVDDDQFTVGVV